MDESRDKRIIRQEVMEKLNDVCADFYVNVKLPGNRQFLAGAAEEITEFIMEEMHK